MSTAKHSTMHTYGAEEGRLTCVGKLFMQELRISHAQFSLIPV